MSNQTNLNIECSSNIGPVYGNFEINATSVGVFYIRDKRDIDNKKGRGDQVTIDGKVRPALDISKFGFKLKDFDNVPLNKFGMKEVASFKDEVLVLTANGYFVIYSDELPSLMGLPSNIDVVSGVWVDENNKLQVPRFSLFTFAQCTLFQTLASNTSFRNIPETVLELIQTNTRLRKYTELEKEPTFSCTYFVKSPMCSKYESLYPRFTKELLSEYVEVVDKLEQFECDKFFKFNADELVPPRE